jgi:hypothetical protein
MDNISILEYSKLSDTTEYDLVLKHLNPKNSFAGGSIDFNKLTYKDVKSCIHLMTNAIDWNKTAELFCIAFGIELHDKIVPDTLIFDKTVKGFWSETIVNYYAAQNYIVKTFKELQERESKLLQSIDADTGLWELAGGAKLNKFSNIMPLIQLGEIYHIFPYDLQNKPYNEILLLLVAHKEKGEVQAEYNRLKSKA